MTFELPFSAVTNTWQLAKLVMAGGRPPLPGPANVRGGWFESLDEYVELLQSCWAQEPSIRPPFSKIILRLRCARAVAWSSVCRRKAWCIILGTQFSPQGSKKQ